MIKFPAVTADFRRIVYTTRSDRQLVEVGPDTLIATRQHEREFQRIVDRDPGSASPREPDQPLRLAEVWRRTSLAI